MREDYVVIKETKRRRVAAALISLDPAGTIARLFRVPDRGSVNPTPLGGVGLRHYPCILKGWKGYKRRSHTIWDCKYHLVWVTKYRYPVFSGDVGNRCREVLRETARAHEMVIHARVDQSGSCPHAAINSAEYVGVEGGAVSKLSATPRNSTELPVFVEAPAPPSTKLV